LKWPIFLLISKWELFFGVVVYVLAHVLRLEAVGGADREGAGVSLLVVMRHHSRLRVRHHLRLRHGNSPRHNLILKHKKINLK